MQDQDIVREFLIESSENLNRLDGEILELERRPGDAQLIGSIFRTVHTVKGSCGFLGFSRLETVAHQAESLLSQVRAGERPVDSRLIELALATSDMIRKCLLAIETSGSDSGVDCSVAVEQLQLHVRSKAARLPDASAAAEAAAPEGERASSAADASIRIDVGLLDKLMNLVGELVLARNQVLQFTAQKEDVALNATSQRLNLITTELQESVMKTRMQPIGVVWNKLPRLVREVCRLRGKQVRLEMEGSDTELDKTLIEAIKDPITHLVRNCCDHGVEPPGARRGAGKPPQGTVRLKAYHEGGQVNIEISDDGAGVDPPRLKQSGRRGPAPRRCGGTYDRPRSAAAHAAARCFHRARSDQRLRPRCRHGRGPDQYREDRRRARHRQHTGAGDHVQTEDSADPGDHPRADCDQRRRTLHHSAGQPGRTDPARRRIRRQIEQVHGTPGLPQARQAAADRISEPGAAARRRRPSDARNIVVLQVEDHQFGLVVDGIQDTQEIVVKPMGKQLKGLAVYAGATIMGDGHVALILDVHRHWTAVGVLAEHREQAHADAAQRAQAVAETQRMLLFRAGRFDRIAAPLGLVARLEEFPRSHAGALRRPSSGAVPGRDSEPGLTFVPARTGGAAMPRRDRDPAAGHRLQRRRPQPGRPCGRDHRHRGGLGRDPARRADARARVRGARRAA